MLLTWSERRTAKVRVQSIYDKDQRSPDCHGLSYTVTDIIYDNHSVASHEALWIFVNAICCHAKQRGQIPNAEILRHSYTLLKDSCTQIVKLISSFVIFKNSVTFETNAKQKYLGYWPQTM